MKRWSILWMLLAVGVASLAAWTSCGQQPPKSFFVVDVWIDTGDVPSLAAYQLELVLPTADIVGVEGSGGPPGSPFAEPPTYDPRALTPEGGGRIRLAAFTFEPREHASVLRVARLHLHGYPFDLLAAETKLVAAATEGGERISAHLELRNPGED